MSQLHSRTVCLHTYSKMYHSLQAVERALLCSLPLLHCLNGCWENQQKFTDIRNKKKKKQAHSSVFRMIGIPSNPLSVCRTENADTSTRQKYVCNSPTVGALVTRVTMVTLVTLVTWDLWSINSPRTQATTTSLGCTFGYRTMNLGWHGSTGVLGVVYLQHEFYR